MSTDDFDVVIYTVLAMSLLFSGVILLLLRKYGPPIRKYDGYLDVMADDVSQIFRLDIETEPEQLRDQKRVVFKVRKIPSISPPTD